MRMHRSLVVAVTAWVAACTGGDSGQWAGTITDSAGVTMVSNPAEGLWGEGDAWTLQEELRIGALEDNPEYQFGQVGFIAAGRDGAIYVLDAQGQNIKVYSATGDYVRTIGKAGAGPGELGRGAAFVLMSEGDTMIVPDVGNQRVNRYAPDGTSLGSFPLSFADGIPLLWRGTSAGIIVRQVRPLAIPGQPAPDSMDLILAQGSDGTIRDTLMRFKSGGTFSTGGSSPEIKLYSAEPVWAVTDDLDIVYGVNDVYRIGFYDGGALTRVVTMPFARKTVGESDKDVVMKAIEQAWRDAGVPPQALQQLRGMIKFGDAFPAFASVQLGPDGSLWVQHIQSVSDLSEEDRATFNIIEDSGAPDWDVFDAEGRYLGVVRMPRRFAPRLFVGDQVYGVARDELDVQYVVRLKVVRPAET